MKFSNTCMTLMYKIFLYACTFPTAIFKKNCNATDSKRVLNLDCIYCSEQTLGNAFEQTKLQKKIHHIIKNIVRNVRSKTYVRKSDIP